MPVSKALQERTDAVADAYLRHKPDATDDEIAAVCDAAFLADLETVGLGMAVDGEWDIAGVDETGRLTFHTGEDRT